MKTYPVKSLFMLILAFGAGCHAQTRQDVQAKITPGASLLAAGAIRQARAAHTATLTDNGTVLIVGGFAKESVGISGTEIFDPKKGEFVAGPSLSVGRSGHTATRLGDGRILIAGGFNGDYLDSAEIYDPRTRRFVPAGKLSMPRSEHAAVLLPNGEVLLAGGVGTNWTFLATAEIFDPLTNSFRKTGAMTTARESHTATLLNDGTVLITGGHRGRRAAMEVFRSTEVFDPKKDVFSTTSDLTIKRHKHDAVLLPDGRVLIVGGADERDSGGAYTSVEAYDPKTKTFTRFGDLKLARYKHQGTTLVLKNGRVLFAGGASRAEILDLKSKRFEIISEDVGAARSFSTATQMNDGRVLIVGGYGGNVSVQSTAWILAL